jgi:ketosteroid isomerase-like protein
LPQEHHVARVVLAVGRPRWLILASTSVLVLLAACQGVPGATSGSSGTSNPCSTNDVRQVVERFIDAFNRGDLAQLDQLVSDQLFSWYSTDAPGQRFNAEAKDRGTLIAYFAARHQQHERLALNSLDVTFTNDRAGGFVFSVTRSADDGLPPTRYGGKGEVQCAIRPISVAVWAMGRRPWSPIDLLPQAAAVILLVAAIGAILWWRRRSAQRHVHVGA